MNVYLAGPVQHATEEDLAYCRNEVRRREAKGQTVYWPQRDTPSGSEAQAVAANLEAIRACDVCVVWFSTYSAGTVFDIGAAEALGKPLVVLNANDLCNGRVVNSVAQWLAEKCEAEARAAYQPALPLQEATP